MKSVLDYALAYARAGYSVIPIKADGSKAPALPSWSEYQVRPATVEELKCWFTAEALLGIGIVCGAVSRNLEVLDFDVPEIFAAFVAKVGEARITELPQVKTPSGGRHLYLHRSVVPPGSRKLAQRLISIPGEKPIKLKVLVETKGEGGQVVAPGTPAVCHATGLPYVWIKPPPGIVLP